MTILCVHRQKPNWEPTKGRPRYELTHDGRTYYVETDGAKPTVAEMLVVTGDTKAFEAIVSRTR